MSPVPCPQRPAVPGTPTTPSWGVDDPPSLAPASSRAFPPPIAAGAAPAQPPPLTPKPGPQPPRLPAAAAPSPHSPDGKKGGSIFLGGGGEGRILLGCCYSGAAAVPAKCQHGDASETRPTHGRAGPPPALLPAAPHSPFSGGPLFRTEPPRLLPGAGLRPEELIAPQDAAGVRGCPWEPLPVYRRGWGVRGAGGDPIEPPNPRARRLWHPVPAPRLCGGGFERAALSAPPHRLHPPTAASCFAPAHQGGLGGTRCPPAGSVPPQPFQPSA